MTEAERFEAAVAAFDAVHREDPSGEELDHALAVVGWVERLRPDATIPLRLAARAQHLGRWRVPRATYADGRAGYLRWRADLQARHAERAAVVLENAGWDEATMTRVRALMHKHDLDRDPEAQTLEDALCLAFIERQLAGFSTRHAEPKLQRILKKTWGKMSPAGRDAALALELPGEIRELLTRSVG